MMMRKLLYSLMLLVVLVLPAAPAYALGSPRDGRVVVGQDFTLKAGETLNGDLVVIGGQAIIEKSASVNGDMVVIGGSLQLDGQASGNAVIVGGMVDLGADSSLAGDMVTIGGALRRAEGSKVGGNVVTNMPPPSVNIPFVPNAPTFGEIPPVPPSPHFQFPMGAFGTAASIMLQSIGLAALGMLLSLFLHPQLDRVAQAITRQPVTAGSIGLLTLLLAPIAMVVLIITILLAPVALAGGILIVLAWLFGVVALGMEVGDRFTRAIHRTWEPVISTGIGTFLLSLGVAVVNLVPCVGWLAPMIVGLIGLGAAVITRFGTQAVSGPTPAPVAVEPGPGVSLPPAS